MASLYSRYGLSPQTTQAWTHFGQYPHNTRERRDFFLRYLTDVVPMEVTVYAVPRHLQRYDITEGARYEREEIQILCHGYIFMTCIVSMDFHPDQVEEVAASLAFYNWSHGFCIPDRHQSWGMVTALHSLRFCSSRDGREWDRTAIFHPIRDVQDVVAYFRQEYERIRRG